MWRDFCGALGEPEWADDPRFHTAGARAENRDLLIDMIHAVLGQHPVTYWEERLRARDVPSTPVHNIEQIVAEEQVKAREMVVEVDVPGVGPIRMAGLPLKFTETPGAIELPPPRLGEHTELVLQRLGYSAAEISDFAASGAIGLDAPSD
jgi:crotonobetainyl-CoA:carnitine CoA-transferase CaiB-like acyl-CoA transferase